MYRVCYFMRRTILPPFRIRKSSLCMHFLMQHAWFFLLISSLTKSCSSLPFFCAVSYLFLHFSCTCCTVHGHTMLGFTQEFDIICPTSENSEEAASFKSRKLDLSISRSTRCVRQGQLCTHAPDSSGSLLPGSRMKQAMLIKKKWRSLSVWDIHNLP